MIDLVYLQARHAELLAARKANQDLIVASQEKEQGFRFVLGEIELMIEKLQHDEQQLAALELDALETALADDTTKDDDAASN